MSAALDAVKEHVELPWRTSQQPADQNANVPSVIETTPQPESVVAQTVGIDAPNSSEPKETSNPPPSKTKSQVINSVKPEEQPSEPATEVQAANVHHRTLHWRNFLAALKEITPSSSEALGTLADLRKWNEEFGEGRRERKKHVWGKGRFGFTPRPLDTVEEGKVQRDPLSQNGVTSADAK